MKKESTQMTHMKMHYLLSKKIVIKTDFVALHRWDDAPDPVFYLATPHRHKFFVVLKFNVSHNDRDIEFLQKKEQVNEWIYKNWESIYDVGTLSCEDMAEALLREFGACFVSVFEDNENGAELELCD